MNLIEFVKDWWKERQKASFSTNYTCTRCGKEVYDNGYFCCACREKLPWQLPYVCPRCGRKTEQGGGICQRCKADPPLYLRARSAFSYQDEIVGYVKAFKNGAQYYSVLFGREMEAYRLSFPRAELMIPVPITAKKRRRRGYNQAELLADYLSERWNLPCKKELILKMKDGDEQKGLSRKERKENVKGLYRLASKKAFQGKGVIIVDDVMTTGSTVNEIARLLKQAGASYIYVLTAVATPLEEHEK
ncbi:MAG: ComF family protein [Clostridia bacterium]|nr:ComF family protein [Clostridia bacterium]